MSLNLECPNCHRVIGEASNADNYIHHFYNHNEEGEPICPNCGTGDEHGVFYYAIVMIGTGWLGGLIIWGFVELIKIII